MVEDKKVYIIKHEKGPIKIGISKSPENRLQELQLSCPYELNISNIIESNQPIKMENALHHRYRQHKIRGEWFNLPEKMEEKLCHIKNVTVHDIRNRLEKTETPTSNPNGVRRSPIIE